MEPILPFWFKQRQCKLEGAGENAYKVTAPNLVESFIRVFPENGRWKAALRSTADGPDTIVAPDTFANADSAWSAAFELYRNRVII